MKIILSPAKRLDFSAPQPYEDYSNPLFLTHASEIISQLRNYSVNELKTLMNISPALAQQNFERHRIWTKTHTPQNSRPAILAYRGAVYEAMKAYEMQKKHYLRLQDFVRIISGAYGLLRPLDLIQPYRLEMKTPLKVAGAKNLYAYWKTLLTDTLKTELKADTTPVLINLASQEYAKAIDFKALETPVITPVFKEGKGNRYSVVAIYAKQARGLMTRFIVENNLQHQEDIKAFDEAGYYFNSGLSSETEYVFTRN